MERLGTFLIIMSGLMLLFYMTGLVTDTATSTLLDLALNPENIASTSLITLILTAVLTLSALGSIFLGFSNKNTELIATGTLISYLLALGWDFLKVFSVVYAANGALAILLMGPLFFIYGLTVFDWWRGND